MKEYLLFPKKTPKYRENRSHIDFLTKLKNHFPSKKEYIEKVVTNLKKLFEVKNIKAKDVQNILERDFVRIALRESSPF